MKGRVMTRNNDRIWVLGAADAEMSLTERILTDEGERVVHATISGERVRGGTAYKADGTDTELGEVSTVYLVECNLPTPESMRRVAIDHHAPHPNAERPPDEFFAASSLGQVVAELIKLGVSPRCVSTCYTRDAAQSSEAVGQWDWAPAIGGLGNASWRCWGPVEEEIREPEHDLPWLTSTPKLAKPSGAYRTERRQWCFEVEAGDELLLCAAADHCCRAAYEGRCPGVKPSRLMEWRAKTRAEFQGRSVDEVLADVERARELLRSAPTILLGSVKVADMRPGKGAPDAGGWGDVPELPEAALRDGRPFVAIPRPGPDGRRKVVLQAAPAEAVEAFLRGEGVARDLLDRYGAAARGFAGGYLK